MQKPFASAADQNRHDILAKLKTRLRDGDKVVELGSGTGQHLCHFAKHMPQVIWQPTELAPMLAGIRMWIDDSAVTNVLPPIELDICQSEWPALQATACYSANTFHIVSLSAIESLFIGCSGILDSGGRLYVYGPFQFGGKFSAPSNARFDQSLRMCDPQSGVRDMETLDQFATRNNFNTAQVLSMPANNFIAIWEKLPAFE